MSDIHRDAALPAGHRADLRGEPFPGSEELRQAWGKYNSQPRPGMCDVQLTVPAGLVRFAQRSQQPRVCMLTLRLCAVQAAPQAEDRQVDTAAPAEGDQHSSGCPTHLVEQTLRHGGPSVAQTCISRPGSQTVQSIA